MLHWFRILVVVCTSSASSAQADTDTPPWWNRERLTGDWFGWRDAVPGLNVDLGYLAEYSDVLRGGARQGGSYRGLLSSQIEWDLDAAFRLPGATLFVDMYQYAGRPALDDVGDVQAISNADVDNLAQIGESWYEQKLWDSKLAVTVGKIDVNARYGFLPHGLEFLHASVGQSPTTFLMPTYPDPSFGVSLAGDLGAVQARVGWFDGATVRGVRTGRRGIGKIRDSFVIGELGVVHDHGSWTVGGWRHTGKIERFDGGLEDGSGGAYLLGEHRLWAPGDDPDAGLWAMLMLGQAEDSIAEVADHALVGVVLRGAIPGRPEDITGLMYSHAGLSQDPAAGFVRDEKAWEWFYQAQLTPALVLTFDLQHIIDPAGGGNGDDATVASVRLQIAL